MNADPTDLTGPGEGWRRGRGRREAPVTPQPGAALGSPESIPHTIHLVPRIDSPKVAFSSPLLVELIRRKKGKEKAFSAGWWVLLFSSRH